MDAIERSDAIEQATMTRVVEIYTGALRKALKNKKAFLQKIADVDSGKIKPPQYYVDRGEVDKWREGFVRELMRQNKVIDGIMEQLNAAGADAAALIRDSMVDIYNANRQEATARLAIEADQLGVSATFAQYDKRQIAVLLQEQQSPFSRLAYQNMGQNPAIRRRLQNELAQATILGESQREIIKRIRKVTGQTVAQARRVAQTERTRVQSQARWQAGNEAAAMGLRVYNTWSTRMINSRESHIALNGKAAMQGERFPGSVLRYPGDPDGRAADVINCHCVLEPHIMRKNQMLNENGEIVDGQVQSLPEYTDCKTIAEAEKFISQYVDASEFYSVGISYKGVHLDVANKINEAIHKVYTMFDLPKLGGIAAPAKNTKIGKLITSHAGYLSIRKSLVLNRENTGSIAAFEKGLIDDKKAMHDILTHPERYDFSKASRRFMSLIEKSRTSGRGIVPETIDEAIYHEMGHHFENVITREQKEKIKERMGMYAELVSGYASDSYSEYIAESFTSYMKGESKIDSYLQSIFDGFRR